MTDNNPDVRKPLILIAEDVESNYKLLEIILKKEYDLRWAKNGREAVDFAMEHKPDAILMDIKMPVMDGIEALKEIRRYTAELPVIMQTAYAFRHRPPHCRGSRMQRIHHQTRHAARTENVSGQIPEQITEKVRNSRRKSASHPHRLQRPAPENRCPAQDSKRARAIRN